MVKQLYTELLEETRRAVAEVCLISGLCYDPHMLLASFVQVFVSGVERL
jgi:hypothetical protein